MPDINDMFPNKYLTALDIGDGKPVVTCANIIMEMGENYRTKEPEEQWFLQMKGTEKVCKLNATSSREIAKTYGTNTDNWIGQKLQLFTVDMSIGGEIKVVLMVRGAPQAAQVPTQVPAQQAAPLQQPAAAGNTAHDDDDLPF
tara:strand:+ start:3729 stop:4157 length:429 start_codon:yes stop_codon:yes gene_type:complete